MAENGTKVSVQIIGIFLSAGNAEKTSRQETTAINRIENQIFIDSLVLIKELFKEAELKKICIYSKKTRKIRCAGKPACKKYSEMMYIASITLYQQMSAPLETKSVSGKSYAGTYIGNWSVVVSLLLCMWMDKAKEVAIFMSLGKTKSDEIFLQTLLEAGSVFYTFGFRSNSHW